MENSMIKPYRRTIAACVMGIASCSVAGNLIPILFVPLMNMYGLAFSSLGVLVTIFFLSELVISLLCSRLPDKYGSRPLLLITSTALVVGLLLLYLVPILFTGHILIGLIIAVTVCGMSAGFTETMINPIISALPFENKSRILSVFHSIFAVTSVVAIVVISLWANFFSDAWNYIALMWVPVPVVCFLLWFKAPVPQPTLDATVAGPRVLLKSGRFYLSVFAMVAGVSCEMIISGGASAFIEKGLQVPKLMGDLLGPCLFSLTFGLGRFLYGMLGEKLNIYKLMVGGSLLCFLLYITAALVPVTMVSIVALAFCGFAVSLLLPGTMATSTARFPHTGVWLLAILNASGKAGAAGGPALFSFLGGMLENVPLSDVAAGLGIPAAQIALRLALLSCAVFPLISLILQAVIRKKDSLIYDKTEMKRKIKNGEKI